LHPGCGLRGRENHSTSKDRTTMKSRPKGTDWFDVGAAVKWVARLIARIASHHVGHTRVLAWRYGPLDFGLGRWQICISLAPMTRQGTPR
jgi:hypothetical protein